MADTEQVPLSWEVIQGWTGEQMKQNMAIPEIRAAMEEAISKHNEERAAKKDTASKVVEEAEQARLARRIVAEEREEAERLAADLERQRREKLTREERIAEDAAAILKKEEEERAKYLEKVAKEKEHWRQTRLTAAEKEAEEIAAQQAEERVEAERVAAEAQAKADAEAERLAAEKVAADKVAAEAAAIEAARKEAEEKAKVSEAVHPKQKIVREYQVRDDQGNPIGRPTHLEADTWEEMSAKQQAAHENAMRLAERLRKRAEVRPEFKQPEENIETLTETQLLEIQKDLDSKDEVKIAQAKANIDINEARKARIQARRERDNQLAIQASYQFKKAHPEYNPCDANNQLLLEYLQKENLAWTAQNLEIAYAAQESQMAPAEVANTAVASREAEIQAELQAQRDAEAKVEADKVAAQAAADAAFEAKVKAEVEKRIEQEKAARIAESSASVAAAASAAAPTSAGTAPAASNAPATTRQLPTGGIEPGSLHGVRPSATSSSTSKPAGYTKQDIIKMDRDEYKRRMRNPEFKRTVDRLFSKSF